MPYYKKRKLANFIKAVIDNEAETKRLIQTSEKLWTNSLNYTPISRVFEYVADSRQNAYCWEFKANEPMFWPVDLHPLAKGTAGGYQGDQYGAVTNAVHDNKVRIGSEVKIKGIALEFMTWCKPQLPYLSLKVSLIRHARDDQPTKDNLYKNYTGNRMLDMMDTRRFKVLKTWNFYHKQSAPTTAGTQVVTDGITANDMNTDAYDGPKAILSDTVKTMQQWFDYIEENHPGYQMMSWDDLPSYWSNTQFFLDKSGYITSVPTGILKYNYTTTKNAGGQHAFGVVHDDYGQVGTVNRYIAEMFEDLAASLNYSYVKQQFSTSPTVGAKQVFIVKKGVGPLGVGPAEDMILVTMDKKHKLWIPGRLLGNGGTVRYKEINDDSYERDSQYDHVLMFQTYLNYKTWDYTTSVTGSYPAIAGRMTDFLQVTYFKDF